MCAAGQSVKSPQLKWRRWCRVSMLMSCSCFMLLRATDPRAVAEPGAPAEPKRPAEYIRVEVRGRLQTGVIAIGGETTGVTIRARGAEFELDLARDAALRRRAAQLTGKSVIVAGTLDVRRGVEVPKRWIVTVKSLKAT